MSKQKLTIIIVAALVVVLLFSAGMMYLLRAKSRQKNINSFTECEKVGGLVLEIYPRQCSLNGKTFTESITISTPTPTSSPVPTTSNANSGAKYFKFVMSDDSNEYFTVKITDSATIKRAEEELSKKSSVIVTGKVREGNGGFNKKSSSSYWNWHLDPETVSFADFTTEICDGRPSFVDQSLSEWKDKQYCPWVARISEEMDGV